MTKNTDVTLNKLRELCNDALDQKISDEEFFKKSMAFFLPNKKPRVKKPKAKKFRRGIGSY